MKALHDIIRDLGARALHLCGLTRPARGSLTVVTFHRVLTPGGLAAVATISPPQPELLRRLTENAANPAHNPSPAQLRTLFGTAGFTLTDQHRVSRPLWTRAVWDLITIGTKP